MLGKDRQAWRATRADPSYVFAETLRDGTAVTVRAAGARDGPKIRRAFLNLERDTVYTRFFGYKADVSDAELGRITGADFERAVALLVTIGEGEDEVVIGGASYFVSGSAAAGAAPNSPSPSKRTSRAAGSAAC